MQDEQSQARRFDDMRKQIEGIAAKQDSTSRNVYKILALLEGDDFADGMVSAVKDHEIRISKLEKIKDKTTWVIMGMSIPTGYGIVEIAKKFWPQIIGGLAILLLFTSCITQKKREDIFHRHAREHREDVLVYCPPPSVIHKEGRADTVLVRDTAVHRVPVYITDTDTVWVDCPEHETVYRYINQVDTIMQEDVAKLEALMLRNQKLEVDKLIAEDRLAVSEQRSKNRLYWLIGGWAIFAVSIALRFIWKI